MRKFFYSILIYIVINYNIISISSNLRIALR